MANTAQVKVEDPEFVFQWMTTLFRELNMLKNNRFVLRLIEPENGEKPFIEVTRNS